MTTDIRYFQDLYGHFEQLVEANAETAPTNIRNPRRFSFTRRAAAAALATVAVGGAVALAATQPWSSDPATGNPLQKIQVSQDPSRMVLGAAPRFVVCTGSNAVLSCTPSRKIDNHARTFMLTVRAGTVDPEAVSDPARPLQAGQVPGTEERIETQKAVAQNLLDLPAVCTPSRSDWSCTILSNGATVPAGAPLYMPVSGGASGGMWNFEGLRRAQ